MVDIARTTAGAISSITVSSADAGGIKREETIATSRLILACGHSARDVFALLSQRDFSLQRKTFAMGVRIEHLQCDIDRAQYGSAAGHPALGAAPYKLVAHTKNGRSLFSFCMCPGGQVVAATSEAHGVVTNGASLYARDGVNANAALLVNINPQDLPGDDPLAGVDLQRSCEHRAFEIGDGAYRAPAQLVGDFMAHRPSTGAATVWAYPRSGVNCADTTIRTLCSLPSSRARASPVTIVRDSSCHALGAEGLYPCGEGAGYAGGIMSAATDGIRCAQALIADLR